MNLEGIMLNKKKKKVNLKKLQIVWFASYNIPEMTKI